MFKSRERQVKKWRINQVAKACPCCAIEIDALAPFLVQTGGQHGLQGIEQIHSVTVLHVSLLEAMPGAVQKEAGLRFPLSVDGDDHLPIRCGGITALIEFGQFVNEIGGVAEQKVKLLKIV